MADPSPPAETVQVSSTWPSFENPFKSSTPLLTKIIAGGMIAIFVICFEFGQFENPAARLFGLVPGNTLGRFYLWNIITSSLYHHNAIALIINLFFLLFAIRYLEQFWGTIEFAKFISFVCGLAGISGLFVLAMLYFSTHEDEYMFPTVPYGGFGAGVAGCTVALKQLLPDYEVRLFGLVGVRCKYVPLLFFVFTVLGNLLYIPLTALPISLFGFVFAWLYLRFIQKRDGVTGDASEQFAIATFFPEPIQPPIKIVSNLVYLIMCCCCPKKTGTPQPRSLDQATFMSMSTMPSVLDQPQDAERRRQVGLKALDARLASFKSSPATKVASQTYGNTPNTPSSPTTLPTSSEETTQVSGTPENV